MCNNNSINSDEKSSVLIDKTKSGKIRPWREKKMANVDYFELLHILEFKKAERVKDCAEVLEYKVSYETGEKTLYRVWFCKSRLCPICNWRRAMKHGIQSQKVVAEVIKQKPTVRWLFLTLTVRNVYDGTELNKLYQVWVCKYRLYPICKWSKTMKYGIQSQQVVAEIIKQKPIVRWLFLKLIVRNVYDGTELNKSLSNMSKGFNRMMKYKKIN